MAKKSPGAPPQYGGGGDVPQGQFAQMAQQAMPALAQGAPQAATMNTPMVSQNAPPTSGPGMQMGNPQGGMFQQQPMAPQGGLPITAAPQQQWTQQGRPGKSGVAPPQYGAQVPPQFTPQGQAMNMANAMRNPNCP